MSTEKEQCKWFIAHIAHCNELKVKDLLDIAGIDYYMPFHKVFRTWNGVQKEFQVPSLPSCVFVRTHESDFIMLNLMREISLILDGQGKPVFLTEEQMNDLLAKLNNQKNKGEIVLQLIKSLSLR